MSEISHINPDTARFDPEAEFGSPEKLATELGLTRGQKLAALKRWRFAVEQRLAAANEGMATETAGSTDVTLLEQIGTVEAQLSERPSEDT